MCGLRVRFRQSPASRGVFGYALRVEVVRAQNMPPKIFVFHQSPAGLDGNTFAEFSHVATPVDFHEIPEDAACETVPWFRTDKCTVWLRSLADAKTIKQIFVDDINGLVRTYNVLSGINNFISQTTVDFEEDDIVIHGDSSDSGSSGGDVPSDIQKEIDELNKNKVDKNALSNVPISVETIEKIRESLVMTARALGANVVWEG